MNRNDVALVTVTYAQREHLLRQVLNCVRGMDVSKIIVVNTGAAWPVQAELGMARVVRTDFRVGSVDDPAGLIKHDNGSLFNS